MLTEVLEDDDSLQVSFARILVNISGMVRAIYWNFLQVKDMCLYFKMEGSRAAPPLLCGQKLKLDEYLRSN
jgi:hypothetical protein